MTEQYVHIEVYGAVRDVSAEELVEYARRLARDDGHVVSGAPKKVWIESDRLAHVVWGERRAPIQGEATNCPRGAKPYGTVAWEEHEQAWQEYHRHHRGQSAERIAERGGFGYWEITDLLGHEPETWRSR